MASVFEKKLLELPRLLVESKGQRLTANLPSQWLTGFVAHDGTQHTIVAVTSREGRFHALAELLDQAEFGQLVEAGKVRVQVHAWIRTKRGWIVEIMECNADDFRKAES